MSSIEHSLSHLADYPCSLAGGDAPVDVAGVSVGETMLAEPVWWLYMVRMADGRLYTGISTDVARRFTQHANGKGARALRGKGPLTLVWQQTVGSHSEALRLEYRLKRWRKVRKEALISTPRLFAELQGQLESAS